MGVQLGQPIFQSHNLHFQARFLIFNKHRFPEVYFVKQGKHINYFSLAVVSKSDQYSLYLQMFYCGEYAKKNAW